MKTRQRVGLVFILASLWVAYCHGPIQFLFGMIGLILLLDPQVVVEDLSTWQHDATMRYESWKYSILHDCDNIHTGMDPEYTLFETLVIWFGSKL